MPLKSGTEATRELRAAGYDGLIVGLTGARTPPRAAPRPPRARPHLRGLLTPAWSAARAVPPAGDPAGTPERAAFEAAGLSCCVDKSTEGIAQIRALLAECAAAAAQVAPMAACVAAEEPGQAGRHRRTAEHEQPPHTLTAVAGGEDT